jgi:hypothetical protein
MQELRRCVHSRQTTGLQNKEDSCTLSVAGEIVEHCWGFSPSALLIWSRV